MKRKVLFEDEYGNKIVIDTDGKICGMNDEGGVVDGKDFEYLLKISGIKFQVANEKGIYIFTRDGRYYDGD